MRLPMCAYFQVGHKFQGAAMVKVSSLRFFRSL